MPPAFKPLATISAWILFIAGCANFIITLITLPFDGVTTDEWMHTTAFLVIATISVFLSMVVMKIRQNMG
ncbi:hypothetical protein ACFLX5_00965 [Chloroflexota bacterium]